MSDNYCPSRRGFLQTALATGAALTALDPFTRAFAAYPENNIDVVIPTREGGGADRLFRAVTTVWKKYLKTNFEPGFYPGASGRVGYEVYMGKKKPDGYNLLFGNMGPELLNWVVKKPTFPVKNCVYFGKVDNDPGCIFVGAKSKFKTIDELVAEGKKRQLNCGTSRLAHPASIGVLALADQTGAKFNLVPLSGGKNTIAGAITGEVDFSTLPSSSVVVSGDQTRALLVFDETNPLPSKLNNAPTMNAHYKTNLPPMLSARAFAIQQAAIDKYPDDFKALQETFKKASEDPELKDLIKKAGSDPAYLKYGGVEDCKKFAERTLELGEHYKALLTGKKA
jgi:tripartite-type tricarboxylate transporter receptor subunit TctC